MIWSVYIVECADRSLYTGVTKDVARRFGEHASGGPRAAKYLRGRTPLKLLYERAIGTQSEALIEERRIKKMTRDQKWQLIRAGGGDVVPKTP